jgi:hypothetical protein
MQLEIFASSVRQLGSSLGLYKGSRQFQQQLSSVRLLLEDESQVELLVNGTSKTSSYPAETWVHGDLKRLVNSVRISFPSNPHIFIFKSLHYSPLLGTITPNSLVRH